MSKEIIQDTGSADAVLDNVPGDSLLDVQKAIVSAIRSSIRANSGFNEDMAIGKPRKSRVFTMGFMLRSSNTAGTKDCRKLNVGKREIVVEVGVDGVKNFDGVSFSVEGTRFVLGRDLIGVYLGQKDNQLVCMINGGEAIKQAFICGDVEYIAGVVVKEVWNIVFMNVSGCV